MNSHLLPTCKPNSYLWLFDTTASSIKTKPCGWSVKKRIFISLHTWIHQKTLLWSYEDVSESEQRFCFLSVLWVLMWSRCESEAGPTGWRWANGGVSQHRNTRSEWGGETDGGSEGRLSNGYRWQHFQAVDTHKTFKTEQVLNIMLHFSGFFVFQGWIITLKNPSDIWFRI